MQQEKWYAQNILEVLSMVSSSDRGLSNKEATLRLERYGTNEMGSFKSQSQVVRFLRQFHNILIYVLLFSAVIALILNHNIDASVIFGVVVLSAIFGFIQEGKAEKAIDSIRDLLAPNANVIRDGRITIIPAKELVRGDIVLIKSGDKVPADLRLIEAKNLLIQEAILTGESNAVEKNIDQISKDAALGDRFNMAYSGTSVTYGRGRGVVVAAGGASEIGKIGSMLKNIQAIVTPLLQQMNVFAKWLTIGILILAAFTFAVGVLFWHESISYMFMAAIGLAVAAIPEGLPPILTIILAIGVTRMAKRSAIIRQLPAVETMGAVTTICTDKTGTLTHNKQTIRSIVTSNDTYEVSGAFNLNGAIIDLNEHQDLHQTIDGAVLCNDAEFFQDAQKHYHIHGNPIDKALLELGEKAKIDLELLQKECPRTDLIPYESEHKFMATLHHSHDGKGFVYIKGAPEQILDKCSRDKTDGQSNPINYEYWHQHIESLAHQGYRVLALATKEVPASKRSLMFDDVEDGLTLVAVLGLIDAPRLEAASAVMQCHAARIKVKMITGDHPYTAATVGAQVGIDNRSGVLVGTDIDKMSDEELIKVVGDINIYARTSPHHKLRLVEALQARGELVAMTGDGVNDAPALCKANIGIAMGKKGAEITKESADMVIADDNFASIVNAVREGRIVYDNLRKVILHLLPTNAAEAFSVIMAILLGTRLPITAVQILWVNMITAVVLATALGFEPAESEVMKRAPRKAKAPILSNFLIWRILLVTVLLVLSVFGLFTFQLSLGVGVEEARTIAVNMLVFGEAIYLLNCRKLYGSVCSLKTIWDGKPALIAIFATIVCQLLFTYLPVMQKFFGTAAISLSQWSYIALLSLSVFAIVEIEKFFIKRLVLKTI